MNCLSPYVAFRTDATATIGFGHISRCISLAKEFGRLGLNSLFICSSETAAFGGQLLRDFPVAVLPSQINEHTDANLTLDQIVKHTENCRFIVLDSYKLGGEWEKLVLEQTKTLLAFDDLGREHHCTHLIDTSVTLHNRFSYEGRVEPECVCLLGPRFVPLDNQYLRIREKAGFSLRNDLKRINVCYGGADPCGLTELTVNAVRKTITESICVDYVAGPGTDGFSDLKESLNSDTRFRHHNSPPNLAQLMRKADLAFGAGGSMNLERCCLGLPAVVVSVADNQEPLSSSLAEIGAIEYLGKADSVSDEKISTTLLKYRDNKDLLHRMSSSAAKLVDGRGARRTAAWCFSSLLELRQVSLNMSSKILEWRNHPINRKYSLNPKIISSDSHEEWLRRILSDSTHSLLVAYLTDRPLGILRFDFQSDTNAEISIYLVPGMHGRGYGLPLLLAGEDWFRKNTKGHVLHATILPKNIASIKVFKDAGYEQYSESSTSNAMFWKKDVRHET